MKHVATELDDWPADEAPTGAAIFVHNERVITSGREQTWAWLVDAERWPHWYRNARRVRILGSDNQLAQDVDFEWVTFGTQLRCRVTTFNPPQDLGWRWWCDGGSGFHGWRLGHHPRGTRVVTEETQRGPRISRLRPLLRPAMHVGHWYWLRQLGQLHKQRKP